RWQQGSYRQRCASWRIRSTWNNKYGANTCNPSPAELAHWRVFFSNQLRVILLKSVEGLVGAIVLPADGFAAVVSRGLRSPRWLATDAATVPRGTQHSGWLP